MTCPQTQKSAGAVRTGCQALEAALDAGPKSGFMPLSAGGGGGVIAVSVLSPHPTMPSPGADRLPGG